MDYMVITDGADRFYSLLHSTAFGNKTSFLSMLFKLPLLGWHDSDCSESRHISNLSPQEINQRAYLMLDFLGCSV